jgi:hypothetical protein
MIHPNDNISAMITAPNAIVTICSFTAFTGAVYARRVIIESNVSFDGSSSLLIDSDGDGVQDIIKASDCMAIAEELERILPMITDDWLKEKTTCFINGLKDAHSRNDDVDFH